MAKFLVSFEVDDTKCFDTIAANRGLLGALGERLAEICICPAAVDWKSTVGLTLYGIDKLSSVRIADAEPAGEQQHG